jgi:hypothetical protein
MALMKMIRRDGRMIAAHVARSRPFSVGITTSVTSTSIVGLAIKTVSPIRPHLAWRTLLTPGLSAKFELWPNVVDHIRLNQADVVHGCDGDMLIAKLQVLAAEDWDVAVP